MLLLGMKKINEKFIRISEEEYLGLRQKVAELQDEIMNLRDSNEYLRRQLFGSKSESAKGPKTATVPFNQLTLFEALPNHEVIEIENVPPSETIIKETLVKTGKKRGRRTVAVDLPFDVEFIRIPEDELKDENGEDLVVIGYETSERLDYMPPVMTRVIIKREVAGYKDSRDYVKVAGVPAAIIPKGKLTDRFVHQIVYDKYANGMPLNRQLVDLNNFNADLSKSTLSDAVRWFAALYKLLAEAIKAQIFSGKYIHVDDSPLKHGNRKAKTETGYFFVYQDREQAYFNYSDKRNQWIIQNILSPAENSRGFIGFLMCDGHSCFGSYAGKRMACWAHVRREFFNMAKRNPNAREVLDMINGLYHIENIATQEIEELSLNAEQAREYRREVRDIKSRVAIDKLHERLLLLKSVSGEKSSMAEAVKYALNRWDSLKVYLEDGELPIDNNAAERSLRSMVVGRKNWLFAGSREAGDWAAVCYTIVVSCKLQGLNPFNYMELVTPELLKLQNNPDADLSYLTPRSIATRLRELDVSKTVATEDASAAS